VQEGYCNQVSKYTSNGHNKTEEVMYQWKIHQTVLELERLIICHVSLMLGLEKLANEEQDESGLHKIQSTVLKATRGTVVILHKAKYHNGITILIIIGEPSSL